jgi:maltose O-acetyltransferase
MRLLREIISFIKRNGVLNILFHIIEVYAGSILRPLPGIEGLFLRGLFYRSLFKNARGNPYIYPSVYIIFSRHISVGKRVAINVNTYIDGRGGISIGNYVMIGPNCVIVSCEHGHNSIEIPMYQQSITYQPVIIENDVWIGGNVTIKSGVKIGSGSIISAGTLVSKDVPPGVIFGGVPGQVLKVRDQSN